MDFSVNARAVTGLADALDLSAYDLTSSASYLRAHSSLRFGAGLINELRQTHELITATVETFLRYTGDDYAGAYSRGISQAVRAYTSTDVNAGARLDATLPATLDPAPPAHSADQSLGPEIFADPSPLSLPTPPDYESEYPYEPEWADLVSPSSVPRDTIWYVTGWLAKLGLLPHPVDPYETFTLPLCGDWAGLERVSFALTSVASALAHVSGRVSIDARTLDQVWTGHAAGNCRTAMQRFAHDLLPAEQLVVQIAADYHEVAVAARKQGEALGTVVSMLVDLCGSLGAELGMELAIDVVADGSAFARIAETLGTLLTQGRTAIELLHALLEAKHAHLDDLCRQLGVLTVRPFAVNLPGDFPVLPAPAHR